MRVHACRMCVRVLYCNLTCARAHKEEHRPVCIMHANWVVEAPVANAAGALPAFVDLLEDEEPQEAPASLAEQAAAAQADEYAKFDAEHAWRAQRLEELDKERAALVAQGPKGQKRKRAEDGDKARKPKGGKPKGGKSPIPGGKGKAGKAGKGAAKKCYVCESTEHVAADCELAEHARRMRQAGKI